MTAELTYQKFLFKINKNNTNGGIACDRFQAVVIINEAKNKWAQSQLKDKNSILVDSLQEVVKSVNLSNPVKKDEYVEYELEEDFLEGILAKNKATKGECSGTVFSREIKNQNKNILQWDETQRPDFDWEWTFHSIQGNKLRVYKKDFDITSTDFEYYMVIPEFDVEGYSNLDGVLSTDKPFILSDQYVDEILSVAAKEFEMNFQNPQGTQIATERINS